jgi:hypothetical protein
VTLCEIVGAQSGIGTGFTPSFFCCSLLIIIPPLLHAHLLLSPEVCGSPDQAVHYHILNLYVGGFTSDPELGWLQSKEVSFFKPKVISNLCLSFGLIRITNELNFGKRNFVLGHIINILFVCQ